MKQLENNWLTSGLIDFEYKKYVLLAYLKDVQSHFDQSQLYPQLSDLVFHYQNLISVKEQKELIYENFPQKISRADFEKLSIQYQKVVQDDHLMGEIEEILEFAIPEMKKCLKEGKDLHDFVAQHLEISPIGISPLYFQEGYLLIDIESVRETWIYEYQMSIFQSAQETFRAIHLQFLETVVKSIGKTLESIKLDIIRKYQKLPNPATYLIYSRLHFPAQETLLPVAKKILMNYLLVQT